MGKVSDWLNEHGFSFNTHERLLTKIEQTAGSLWDEIERMDARPTDSLNVSEVQRLFIKGNELHQRIIAIGRSPDIRAIRSIGPLSTRLDEAMNTLHICNLRSMEMRVRAEAAAKVREAEDHSRALADSLGEIKARFSRGGKNKAANATQNPERESAIAYRKQNPAKSALQIKTALRLKASERTIRGWLSEA